MTKIKHRQLWIEEGQEVAWFTDEDGKHHDIKGMIEKIKVMEDVIVAMTTASEGQSNG